MAEIDRSLVFEARKFTTGANVHLIKTWIFCYETSRPDTPQRGRYEKLLRKFVASSRAIEACFLVLERSVDLLDKTETRRSRYL
jgi:hypothetical protein